MTASETLIFQHIPKTAGSTLHSVLNQRFRTAQTYNIFASNYHDPEARALISLSDERKRRIRLLKGHMPFGLHQFLPQHCVYFTVLREPVERVISQYFYIRKNKQNPLHEKVVGGDLGLAEFVSSGISVGMHNGHVRWLAGELHAHGFDANCEQLLATAKRNIDAHFAVVGLTDRFDETLLLLGRKLGWKRRPYYTRENVAPKRRSPGDFDAAELDVVREYNRYDIELYEWARARFEQQLAHERISDELGHFQRRNRLYQKLSAPFMRFRR